MAESEIVVPIIHLNGDRKEVLLERLERAYDALQAAYALLKDCAPNGRNYYPAPGLMERAIAQHLERQRHLDAVLESIDQELGALGAL